MAKYEEEAVVEITNGTRRADVTLRRYENGWVVHAISEIGYPVIETHDNTFSTKDLALNAARTIWLP